jgi:hypothetical protein
MVPDQQLLSSFRARVKASQEAHREAWADSRRLIAADNLRMTLSSLIAAIQASSALPEMIRGALIEAICHGAATRVQDLDNEALKALTGLPPAKALRALCLFFEVAAAPDDPTSALTASAVEDFVRRHTNPYDLLAEADVSSVLDLGAGDLTFAEDLVSRYLPMIEERGKTLTVHCVDRLRPGSKVGGLYHADPDRLARLRHHPSPHLEFRFWGNQDMFDLREARGLMPKYTVVTCQAPPTPTVAYEPSRLSPSVIRDHLVNTKGEFRIVREGGEEALEVRHAGRTLLFPPWKFDVRGPVALLNVLSRRGALCVLSAVDSEVFWELLSQLLDDQNVRPQDTIFTQARIPDVFGALGSALVSLPVGASMVLSDRMALRDEIPEGQNESLRDGRRRRFRYVEVRRGALFPEVPASRTAKMFKDMTEEVPPWFLVLVPEELNP